MGVDAGVGDASTDPSKPGCPGPSMLRTVLPWVLVAIVLVVQLGLWLRADRPSEERDRAGAPPASSSRGGAEGWSELAERIDRLEASALAQPASLERPDAGRERSVEPNPGAAPDLGARLAALEARLEALEAEREPSAEDLARRQAMRRLTDALARGDVDGVHGIVNAGTNLDAKDDEGQTPLNAAAVAGRLELIDLLVDAGASLERKGKRGMTPLLAALDAVQEETALHLLDLGADGAAVDKNGESALIWAAFNGTARVAERLLDMGVDVDFQAHDGNTALADAVRREHVDLVRLLLERGADPNKEDKAGRTPLDAAEAKGLTEIAALLRRFGAE